ncbi:Lsr2 family protein [Streptomyces sp. NPDC059688]|uniref:histone-like nucleoid-structuring protein Lsr2 n=1 Tax=Streptomyces sp. NPDC059688 TaxID=3346906 RepID=UPI00368EBA32
MVRKTVTVHMDDLTGEESEDVRTHSFSLNGVNYEIDLVSDNYDRLFDALAPFISSGRKVGYTKGVGRARAHPSEGPSAAELRAWARSNNYDVSDRGRISARVRLAFAKAH